jgi:hypothetical protein
MTLREVTDARVITQAIIEAATIPSSSPYINQLNEVPDQFHGVKITRITPTVFSGTGSGIAVNGGQYLGTTNRNYKIQIDTAGGIGVASFKWSRDGGSTWVGILIPITDTDPFDLELGLTIQFPGGSYGLDDYWTFSAEYWSEVSYIPIQSKQYQVDYADGNILFHSADASKSISVSYEGRGSLVKADDINQVVDLLNANLPFHRLDMAMVCNGDVLTSNGEILFSIPAYLESIPTLFGSAYLGRFHGDPLNYGEGDIWYDLDAHIWRTFNGTNKVNL